MVNQFKEMGKPPHRIAESTPASHNDKAAHLCVSELIIPNARECSVIVRYCIDGGVHAGRLSE